MIISPDYNAGMHTRTLRTSGVTSPTTAPLFSSHPSVWTETGAAWTYEGDFATMVNSDDGNYEPSNCRWTTTLVNARNRRSNVLITAWGETKLLIEWAEDPRCAVGYPALSLRIRRRGWEPELAIATPSGQVKRYRDLKPSAL